MLDPQQNNSMDSPTTTFKTDNTNNMPSSTSNSDVRTPQTADFFHPTEIKTERLSPGCDAINTDEPLVPPGCMLVEQSPMVDSKGAFSTGSPGEANSLNRAKDSTGSLGSNCSSSVTSPADPGLTRTGSSTSSLSSVSGGMYSDDAASPDGGVTSGSESSSLAGEKGRRKWEKPYELPPCRVCGGKGTGLHYGVNTCEACKGFFRRSLSRADTFECRKNGRCELKPERRTMCPKCRFKKCLDVGMSLSGIKNGRTSLAKKIQDIAEVKRLKAIESQSHQEERFEQCKEEVEGLLRCLVDAFQKSSEQWDFYDQQMMQLNMEFLSKHSVGRGVIAEATAVQPGDQSRVEFYNKCFENREGSVRNALRFCKAIPGFRDLLIEDQVELFKGSLSDLSMVNRFKNIDPETGRWGNSVKIEYVFGKDLADMFVNIAKRLQALKLTQEETAVLNALVLFNTDCCDLKDPDRVADMYNSLVETLQWLLKRSHPGDSMVFPRLVSALTEMRTLGQQTKQLFGNVVSKGRDMGAIDVPRIFEEVLG